MLSFYVGFQVIKFYCFPSTTTTFLWFSFSTTTTATAATFLLFSLLHHHHHISIVFSLHHHHHISIVFPPPPPPPPHFYCFLSSSYSFHFWSPRDSIKDCQLPLLVHLVAMCRVLNNNRVFLQLLADCPVHQRQFLLKTATPQQLHALVQVLYTILMGHISIPEESRRILQSYKDALLDLARPDVSYKLNKDASPCARG